MKKDKKQLRNMKDIGARFSIARGQLELTQLQLADLTGLSLPTIRAYEQGVSFPTYNNRKKIINTGINMDYVENGEGDPLLPSHLRPKKIVMNTKAMTIREVDATYKIGDDEEVVDDPEILIKKESEAYEQLERILERIGFKEAHFVLKSRMLGFLMNQEITPHAAEILLILFRDEINYYEEKIEKMKETK